MKNILPLLAALLLPALACAVPSLLPTPTVCPQATPEQLWVEPIPAATDQDSILVEVYIGNGEQVIITAESGTFVAEGSYSTLAGRPAQVEVTLLPGVTHHLDVVARVKEVTAGGCPYGGYTLTTMRDRDGGPLEITQTSAPG